MTDPQPTPPARSRTLTEVGGDSNRGEERASQREGTPVSLGFIAPEVCAEHAGAYLMPHGTPDRIVLYVFDDKGVPVNTHTHVDTNGPRTAGVIYFGAWQDLNLGRTAFSDWSSTGTRPAAWHELGPAS